MKFQSLNICTTTIACLIVAACSGGGDWPDLSEPAQGYSESAPEAPTRIVAPPTLPATTAPEAKVPASDYERTLLVRETLDAFDGAEAALRKEISDLEFARPDEKTTAWNATQIKLTRLSQIADRLNGLINLNHHGAITADANMADRLDGLGRLLAAAQP